MANETSHHHAGHRLNLYCLDFAVPSCLGFVIDHQNRCPADYSLVRYDDRFHQ